ncbi:MAG TPA: hypothetical protein VG326_05265 [Tepidisphaeraceae bacterium]|jgi:hypothetical protein|nr:hypothetical protein [Tepidisphaeraceae bacterium]
MAPIAPIPQNSRAGLITSVVVFVVLFVTATICAIYYGTQWQAEIVKSKEAMSALADTATPKDVALPEVQAISQDARKRGMTGIQVALEQRSAEAKIITGNPAEAVADITADTRATVDAVKSQLAAAKVPATVGEDNLLASLKTLATQIVTLNSAVAAEQAKVAAATADTAAAVKSREALLKEKDTAIAAAKQEAMDAGKGVSDREAANAAKIADIQKAADDAAKQQQQITTAAQNELTKVQAELKKALDSYSRLQRQLAQYRLDPTKGLLRPAGEITRSPGNNTVFINLGQGQELSLGLTFEVYDRRTGIPQLTQGNSPVPELAAGKASIEVIRIMPGTSECRIIRVATGMTIVEGDPIVNLVYNTHTKFNFCVYGEFDLANTGSPTAGDVDVIRRLVTQWGGGLMDHVSIDTDFLVLGKEPVVLPLPDNANDIDRERHDKAQKALDAFLEIEGQAIHLNIPTLNQNRFLYFVGYYDQAKR